MQLRVTRTMASCGCSMRGIGLPVMRTRMGPRNSIARMSAPRSVAPRAPVPTGRMSMRSGPGVLGAPEAGSGMAVGVEATLRQLVGGGAPEPALGPSPRTRRSVAALRARRAVPRRIDCAASKNGALQHHDDASPGPNTFAAAPVRDAPHFSLEAPRTWNSSRGRVAKGSRGKRPTCLSPLPERGSWISDVAVVSDPGRRLRGSGGGTRRGSRTRAGRVRTGRADHRSRRRRGGAHDLASSLMSERASRGSPGEAGPRRQQEGPAPVATVERASRANRGL